MLFSVIVPVFNGEQYLDECLSSVDAQTFTDFELIIIDDGSTDKSGHIADNYKNLHTNVRVMHGPNEGLLLARRRGIRAAVGQYIVFLDADDALRKDALAIIAEKVSATNADIISFEHTADKNFSYTNGRRSFEAGLYAGDNYEIVKQHVCAGRFNNLCGKAIRNSCIDKERDYEPFAGLMHGEDWLQLLPIIDASSSLYHIEEALYYYRPNDSSSTARFRLRQLDDIVQVTKRLRNYAEKWGGDCPAIACGGEALQYTYLLKISELSSDLDAVKRVNFSEIRFAMQNEGVFDRVKAASLRPDNRLLVIAIQRGSFTTARIIIHAVEALKR